MKKRVILGCGPEQVIRHISPPPPGSPKLDWTTQELLLANNVIAFCDNEPTLIGKSYFDVPIISEDELSDIDYDEIILSVRMQKDMIFNKLVSLGVPAEKINRLASESYLRVRETFVHYFSKIIYANNINGSVAEGGVARGDFSRVINHCFPDRKLHLFDTFEGFPQKDIESDLNYKKLYLTANRYRLLMQKDFTSEELVLSRLPYPDKAVIHKGYFPESATGINDIFAFVCLDFDLFAPIKAGLEFFYPKMAKGGVILVHDYFVDKELFDTKKAVDDFCKLNGLGYAPIADQDSIIIIKQ